MTSLSPLPSSPKSPNPLSSSISAASSPKARVNVRQDAQLRQRESLLHFICAALLPSSGTNAETDLEAELETAAINALDSLAAVAPLNDSDLERQFVHFLTDILKRSQPAPTLFDVLLIHVLQKRLSPLDVFSCSERTHFVP